MRRQTHPLSRYVPLLIDGDLEGLLDLFGNAPRTTIHGRRGETVRLPVAIAAVIASDVLTSIHIYHSMWPLMRAHAIRSPILPAMSRLRLPDVVERYHDMLSTGDVSGMLEQFDADAVVREPTGEREHHRGRNLLGAVRVYDDVERPLALA